MSASLDRKSFQETQTGIYNKFATTQAELGSTAILLGNISPQGAFLVAFRHPDEITEPTAALSGKIRDTLNTPDSTVRSLVYDRDVLHTTLSDYRLGEALVDPGSPEDRKILDALSLALKRGLGEAGLSTIQKRKIDFDSPLVNANSAIIPGHANNALLDIIRTVRDASRDTIGVEGLKGSWGAHMTAARFHGQSTLAQARNVAGLATGTQPIGTAAPTAIDVGYLAIDSNGFHYTTHERFSLGK